MVQVGFWKPTLRWSRGCKLFNRDQHCEGKGEEAVRVIPSRTKYSSLAQPLGGGFPGREEAGSLLTAPSATRLHALP